MHAFGIAAEAQIVSATMRQEIRDELNLIWESMQQTQEDTKVKDEVKSSSKRSREIGPDEK